MARQGGKTKREGGTEDQREKLPVLPRNFSVTIDGVEFGFAGLSRLASQTVAERPDDDLRAPAREVHRYANVVLRRALGSDRRLYLWRENIISGKKDRRQVVIRHLDATGSEATSSWILEGAWPWRWAGPAFDAGATEIAMEEIELAFDRLVWR
jgi:phage tail-like protein